MANNYRPFGYIMAANVEAIGLFLAAWWGAGWLNENYPMKFNWMPVLFLFALIAVCISWYRMFSDLVRKKDKDS